jgi:hypothetical protein
MPICQGCVPMLATCSDSWLWSNASSVWHRRILLLCLYTHTHALCTLSGSWFEKNSTCSSKKAISLLCFHMSSFRVSTRQLMNMCRIMRASYSDPNLHTSASESDQGCFKTCSEGLSAMIATPTSCCCLLPGVWKSSRGRSLEESQLAGCRHTWT